jgi:AAA15 family ATPase/GTPase
MLLNFKTKNFKSFYNETEISMIADSAKRDLNDRLINVSGKKTIKKNALPSMVIYGANASGKTSIISAINMLKQIVINGTIKKQIKNKDIKELDICSFIHDNEKLNEPIHLEITFKTDEYIYNYLINVIATYINPLRKIVSEELNIVEYKKIGTSVKENKINIYKRFENSVELNKDSKAIKLLGKDDNFSKELDSLEKTFSENLDKEDLFLTTGFKSMISLKMSSDILNWFQEKLITVVDFNVKEPLLSFDDTEDSEMKVFRNNQLDKLIKIADFGPQQIGYIKDNNTGKYTLNSFYTPKGAKQGIIINSKTIESKGTIKLIDFWIGFMEFFKKGGVFVLDEFDCSIHPELVSGIIDLFNNEEINTNHAQLIFNTHNPLYLQKKFFRRDQIMFVEKDEETYMSSVYKLSDIEIRNDASYMKNYFEGKFGALPFIDFETALNQEEGAD